MNIRRTRRSMSAALASAPFNDGQASGCATSPFIGRADESVPAFDQASQKPNSTAALPRISLRKAVSSRPWSIRPESSLPDRPTSLARSQAHGLAAS